MEDVTPNRLLAELPNEYLKAFLTKCRPVVLPVGAVLYSAGETPAYAHFMTSGIASVVAFMQAGEGVEVGVIGSEGLVEAVHLLGPASVPTSGFIQVVGSALRIRFDDLITEFRRSELLRTLIHRTIQAQAFSGAQIAACNRLHEVEPRLARWLLMVQDRVNADGFDLTQEFVAEMIGARRTTVSQAAGNLQRIGLIQYARGHIQILDRQGLEKAACECYPVVRDIFVNLYK